MSMVGKACESFRPRPLKKDLCVDCGMPLNMHPAPKAGPPPLPATVGAAAAPPASSGDGSPVIAPVGSSSPSLSSSTLATTATPVKRLSGPPPLPISFNPATFVPGATPPRPKPPGPPPLSPLSPGASPAAPEDVNSTAPIPLNASSMSAPSTLGTSPPSPPLPVATPTSPPAGPPPLPAAFSPPPHASRALLTPGGSYGSGEFPPAGRHRSNTELSSPPIIIRAQTLSPSTSSSVAAAIAAVAAAAAEKDKPASPSAPPGRPRGLSSAISDRAKLLANIPMMPGMAPPPRARAASQSATAGADFFSAAAGGSGSGTGSGANTPPIEHAARARLSVSGGSDKGGKKRRKPTTQRLSGSVTIQATARKASAADIDVEKANISIFSPKEEEEKKKAAEAAAAAEAEAAAAAAAAETAKSVAAEPSTASDSATSPSQSTKNLLPKESISDENPVSVQAIHEETSDGLSALPATDSDRPHHPSHEKTSSIDSVAATLNIIVTDLVNNADSHIAGPGLKEKDKEKEKEKEKSNGVEEQKAPSKVYPEETIFAKLVRKEIAAKIVYEDSFCLAINDVNPQAPIHILLLAKKFLPRLSLATEIHEEMLGKLFSAIPKIAKAAGIGDEGFRVVVNDGEMGGQTVYHLHVHILSGRKMNWPPG